MSKFSENYVKTVFKVLKPIIIFDFRVVSLVAKNLFITEGTNQLLDWKAIIIMVVILPCPNL